MGSQSTLERPNELYFFNNVEAVGRVTHIAAGSYHSLAACDNTKIFGWGSGQYGENGLSDFQDSCIPKLVAPFALNP